VLPMRGGPPVEAKRAVSPERQACQALVWAVRAKSGD